MVEKHFLLILVNQPFGPFSSEQKKYGSFGFESRKINIFYGDFHVLEHIFKNGPYEIVLSLLSRYST
jgi:hypothetical protein